MAKDTPIFASDGSVISSKLENHEYENLYSSAQDGVFCKYLPNGGYTPTRVNKSGWYMYNYENHTTNYTAVINSVYNQNDFENQSTRATLTFSDLLEIIHNFTGDKNE